MTESDKREVTPTRRVNVSDWYPIIVEKAPDIFRWTPISVCAAGFMLCASPVQASSRVLIGVVAVLLSVVVFVVAWETGRSMFALHCDSYRRLSPHKPLRLLLPFLAIAAISLGLIGGHWWWLFSPTLAFWGHRKGTQRAWWTAVVLLAFSLRTDESLRSFGGYPPSTDEEALELARDGINGVIGTRRK